MGKDRTLRREGFTPAGLQVRTTDGGGRIISGYAIVFGAPSLPLWRDSREEAREIIEPEAVDDGLLAASDIKMTLFHDDRALLARSENGTGTLSYRIDGHGVAFEFEAPNTADGDKAVELVRRGDIAGCSFAFTTDYGDASCVETAIKEGPDGVRLKTYHVRKITGIYDFTLTPSPAYPATSCETRDLMGGADVEEPVTGGDKDDEARALAAEQVRTMREEAFKKLII